MNLCERSATQTALVWLLAASLVPLAAAEVLNPYALPSQQSRQGNAPPPQTQAGTSASVRDAYYLRFAEDTRTLKKEERAALVKNFTQKKDQALQNGRIEEALHYGRLVQILEANR